MRRIVLFGMTLAVGLACVALGFWQLSRLRDRRAANAEVEAAEKLPPIEYPGTGGLAPRRRAVFRGVYDSAQELLVRNRLVRGVPAVMVVSPLRTAGSDTAILVNRGYVPAADATNPGTTPFAEPGPQVVRGMLLPVPSRGDGVPLIQPGSGLETWKALDLAAMRARIPYPIHDLYLIATADSASARHTAEGGDYPIRAEPPPLGDGPHLMYALQWFGIATAVVTFGVFFVLRRRSVATVDD